MKKRFERVATRFAPETRFKVTPLPVAPVRGKVETELERLKARLLKELVEETPDSRLIVPLRRAANDAVALVWLTPFPLLLLPVLLGEKAKTARVQIERQKGIREGSNVLLALAG